MSFNRQKYQVEQEQYQREHQEMFQKFEKDKAKKKRSTKIILGLVFLLLVLGGLGSAWYYYSVPGEYDNFAKCLTEKGAVMYGAISWCKYTQGQANMFGKSFKYIDYRDESELLGIKTRPTWVINGQWYEKVQSFETLSAATSCIFS